MKKDKVVIDFIPVIEGGDIKRVYDHGLVKVNQVILAVFTQLQMEKGTLEEFPEAGCLQTILNMYYEEDVSSLSTRIANNFSKFQNETVLVDIVKDGDTATIHVNVENIPNYSFAADIERRNQTVHIVNPKIISV